MGLIQNADINDIYATLDRVKSKYNLDYENICKAGSLHGRLTLRNITQENFNVLSKHLDYMTKMAYGQELPVFLVPGLFDEGDLKTPDSIQGYSYADKETYKKQLEFSKENSGKGFATFNLVVLANEKINNLKLKDANDMQGYLDKKSKEGNNELRNMNWAGNSDIYAYINPLLVVKNNCSIDDDYNKCWGILYSIGGNLIINNKIKFEQSSGSELANFSVGKNLIVSNKDSIDSKEMKAFTNKISKKEINVVGRIYLEDSLIETYAQDLKVINTDSKDLKIAKLSMVDIADNGDVKENGTKGIPSNNKNLAANTKSNESYIFESRIPSFEDFVNGNF